MSPDMRTEFEGRLKSTHAEILGCRKDHKALAESCARCRQERRDAEATIVAATNALAKKTSAYQAALLVYIKTVNDGFAKSSLTIRKTNGRR